MRPYKPTLNSHPVSVMISCTVTPLVISVSVNPSSPFTSNTPWTTDQSKINHSISKINQYTINTSCYMSIDFFPALHVAVFYYYFKFKHILSRYKVHRKGKGCCLKCDITVSKYILVAN